MQYSLKADLMPQFRAEKDGAAASYLDAAPALTVVMQ